MRSDFRAWIGKLAPSQSPQGREPCRSDLRPGTAFAALLLALACATALRGDAELAEGTRALYRGEYEIAAVRAQRYLKAHPGAAGAEILLARARIAQGQYPAAYEELLRALRSDPKNLDALYYLGRVCVILSQVEYRQLFQMAPDSYRSHQILAESYLAQQNKAKAEEEYKAALKANERSVEVLDALGDLKRASYQLDEAVTYYARAAKLSPGDYDSVYGLGACALFQNQHQQAIEHFQRALAIDPNSAAARLALGDALLRANQPREAAAELRKAVALEPDMRQAYTLLARAYGRLGLSQAADEALKKERELAQAKSEELVKILSSGSLPAPLGLSPPPLRPPRPEQ